MCVAEYCPLSLVRMVAPKGCDMVGLFFPFFSIVGIIRSFEGRGRPYALLCIRHIWLLVVRLSTDVSCVDVPHPLLFSWLVNVCGTRVSPTQACDCWSIGVIAYMLLAGMPPFIAPSDEGVKLKIKWAKVRGFPIALTGT